MGASKILLPRDLRRRAFLLIREPCSASHSVNLACSDMQTLATKAAHLRERYEPYSSLWALTVEASDEPIHK